MKKICVVLVLCALGLSEGKDLSSLFTKCKKSDENLSKCLTDSVNKGWSELVKANSSWASIDIGEVTEEIVNLARGSLSNGKLEGLEEAQFVEIKIDFKKKVLNVIFTCPRISVVGNTDLKGSVLGVNLNEKALANISYYGGIYNYRFKYILEEKELEDYLKVIKNELAYNVEGLNINFTTPNAERSARNNKVFNDNWKLLNVLSSSTAGRVLSNIFTTIISKFLEDIPFNTLFE